MKATLLVMTVIIMIYTATTTTTITALQQHYQTAQAFRCIGGSLKIDYCIGYHAGAIEAHRDFNLGHDLAIYQHQCTPSSTDYCNGYDRGYSDEADFLG